MLDTVLLGLVRLQPSSGYDLRGDLAAGPWRAELSQVYPTLRRMEARGWLASDHERSRRGPARRVYRLTPAGQDELTARLRAGPTPARERLAWLGQLRLLPALGRADADAWLERLGAQLQSDVEAATEGLARWTDAPRDDAGLLAYAAASCTLATARARLDWWQQTMAAWRQRPASGRAE